MERRPLDPHGLIARAQKGDLEAYEEIVRLNQTLVFRTAFLITGNAADAEDVAQDAFFKAWRALQRFRPDQPFRPWLLRIVTNEALNRRRGTWSRERLVQHLRQHDVSAATAPPPDASIDNAARRESLFRALAELPEPQRLTFVYRHILGMSEAETSEVLDTPVGTVKSRAARALDAIRGQLNEH